MSVWPTPIPNGQAVCLEFGGRKYWRAIQAGRLLLLWWGRIDSEGQFKLITLGSASLAITELTQRAEAKVAKGYEEKWPDALSTDRLAEIVREYLDELPYKWYWEATEPVLPAHLAQAAEAVDDLLASIGRPGECQVRLVTEGRWCHVVCQAGRKEAYFGYPSQGWRKSLELLGQRLRSDKFPSRDNWLSNEGTGSGAIKTGRGMLDLPVRLLLWRLAHTPGLWVDDTLSLLSESPGLDLVTAGPFPPREAGSFAWQATQNAVIQAAAERGWLPTDKVRLGDHPFILKLGDRLITCIDW